MRTYGRSYDDEGNLIGWIVVETDAKGYNDNVYLTTLIQNLKLNLQESPFYGDWGIPAVPSVLTQVQPDYNTQLTQQRFAPKFASLLLSKKVERTVQGAPLPVYAINIVTQSGSILNETVAR